MSIFKKGLFLLAIRLGKYILAEQPFIANTHSFPVLEPVAYAGFLKRCRA